MSSIYKKGRDGYYYYQVYVFNKETGKNDKRILKDKEPLVVLSELADSSVNIMVRVWVKSDDFLEVKFDYNEKVYSEFPRNGLSIPFPQLDVNLNK